MEWIALLAFLLCLVYLPKFRKVMMWIGIIGVGLGAVGLGVWKIKEHYDQKRVEEAWRQQQEQKEQKEQQELDQLRKKLDRGEGLTDDEVARLGGFDPVPPELERVRQKAARGEALTDLDKALLEGGKLIPPQDFVPDPVQPKPAAQPFDPDKYLREKAAQRKHHAKKDQPGDWVLAPGQKAP